MDNLAINFLDVLLTPFRWVYFGLAGCALLISIALFSVQRMKKESAQIIADIDKANEALSKFQNAEEFTNQFHVIDGQLKGISRLSRSWEEFSKTLLPPLDEIDEPEYRVFRTTKRPVDYFDIDHLSAKVKPIIDSESLIGIGLVLTFFGLVAALIHAGLKIGGTVDTQEVQVAIQELLSTAGAKFFASIGGVGGSLIQTIL